MCGGNAEGNKPSSQQLKPWRLQRGKKNSGCIYWKPALYAKGNKPGYRWWTLWRIHRGRFPLLLGTRTACAPNNSDFQMRSSSLHVYPQFYPPSSSSHLQHGPNLLVLFIRLFELWSVSVLKVRQGSNELRPRSIKDYIHMLLMCLPQSQMKK